MGSVKIDTHSKERALESKYPALDNPTGVRILLGDYHALVSRRYAGDYDACVILADLGTARAKAQLTERQADALYYVFERDLTQVRTAELMGVSKQTVNRLVNVALTKIARVYEAWSRRGEGYALSETEAI
ncbi:sigma factor-like helix-turn-helix DNA-binding protein [Cytobacillus sp. FSL R7-0696]|uniref:sigma factor-like helix-turn-helix DNA-binding protein n=1 Tax=Cytobacillus sp. FSL R7-0696 TaxID=2921691 RepID=UPI0030FC24D0